MSEFHDEYDPDEDLDDAELKRIWDEGEPLEVEGAFTMGVNSPNTTAGVNHEAAGTATYRPVVTDSQPTAVHAAT